MRIIRLLPILVFALSACSPLPEVSADIVQSIEGDGIAIVAEHEQNNPSNQWVYTYLLLELESEASAEETFKSVLSKSGWEVSDHGSLPDGLGAKRAEADLTLVGLTKFLANRSDSASQEFQTVERGTGKEYFVAIMMPLGY